jgi:GAF domain-containing protein
MPDRYVGDVVLAETFAEMARVLLEERSVEAMLARICHLAVAIVEGCQSAGISIVDSGGITSWLRTDEMARVVDQIQAEIDEGPCIDAIRLHELFISGSLSDEPRWPNFSRRAHDHTGVESVLSLRLFAGQHTLGALNLYSSRPHAFDDQDVAVGSVFAAHAAVALAGAERGAQLEAKAASRDVIGTAKGIIMARGSITDDEAFAILRRSSQRLNLKLREVAENVVHPHDEGAT